MKKYIAYAAAACAALATPGIASAAGHEDLGFYFGVGTQVSHAELTFDKPYAAGTTVYLSNVTGMVGTFPLQGVNAAFETRIPVTVTARADDDTPVAYGAHIGFKLSRHVAIELGYAELGDFTATYSTNVTGVFTINVGAPLGLTLAETTLAFKAIEDVNVFSGAVLANYPINDYASVFGRLGYYATDTSESLKFDWQGPLVPAGEINISGGARLSTPVVDEAAGLLYGGGVELALGPGRDLLLRGEFTLLQDGLGELEDITVFGLNISYRL